MTRLEAERLLLDALTVRAHTTAHHPHALGLAERLVQTASLALLGAQTKKETP